ncbi:MAG: alpha/beta hydrolase [Firmicutes bacterium]|nr:alpha/beta hydrolase [Bacillota bacterium]
MNISRVYYTDARYALEVTYTPDVVFAKRESGDLKLQLLLPRSPIGADKGKKYPLIVDVAGSGWRGVTGYEHVPKMVGLASRGFAVACIAYRGTEKDSVTYPAAVQDTKEAIRFLRANAERFGIDADHVTLLGDSSGGHTVAAAALTGNEEFFNIGEYPDERVDVNAVVMFYAPIDFPNLIADRKAEGKRLRRGEDPYPIEGCEVFGQEFYENPEENLKAGSPINYIGGCGRLPAFLLIQGEEDPIIPMAQGLRFCDRVIEAGGRAEFIKVCGAGHGGACWTPEVMETIAQFLLTYN